MRLAAESIDPRADSLRYLDVSPALVHGNNPVGRGSPHRGISVLDAELLLPALEELDIRLAAHWNRRLFGMARDLDVLLWLEAERASPRSGHPGASERVAETLASAGMAGIVEAAAASDAAPWDERADLEGRLVRALERTRRLEARQAPVAAALEARRAETARLRGQAAGLREEVARLRAEIEPLRLPAARYARMRRVVPGPVRRGLVALRALFRRLD
jgi:hypothetical protein